MTAYYNEIDPYAAQWLRNLIAADHIAPGDVDERSITEVQPDDLRGYRQCHFFAGIGGWSYAMRLAGWPDDRPVWTGSCPCQPFSAAGKQRGSNDERHLWPAFFNLIRQCRPGTVFGEQVAGAAGLAWWDHVAADLEGAGYAAAAANLGAHSVGAPHIRQRLYWVAHTNEGRSGWDAGAVSGAQGDAERGVWGEPYSTQSRGATCSVAHADGWHASAEREQRGGQHGQQPEDCGSGALADGGGGAGLEVGSLESARRERASFERGGTTRTLADDDAGRSEQRSAGVWWSEVHDFDGRGARVGVGDAAECGQAQGSAPRCGPQSEGDRPPDPSPWHDLIWLPCSDGKARPTQPGLQPLAHGASARVGRLRAYGNAIVPQVAAAFVMVAS